MNVRVMKLVCCSLLWIGMLAAPVSAQVPPAAPQGAPTPTPQPQEQNDESAPIDPEGMAALSASAGGATISIAPQTGAARFIRFTPRQSAQLSASLDGDQSPQATANSFLSAYGSVFGIQDTARELTLETTQEDALGDHLVYQQMYQGLPVFAGILKVHLNAQGQISTINGMFIPDITVSVTPKLTLDQAKAIALGGAADDVTVKSARLLIYRENLARGISGLNHLAYEIEIGNQSDVHENVYVDAIKGNIVDRLQLIYDFQVNVYNGTVDNLAYSGSDDPAYSGGDSTVEDLIKSAKETYNLYKNLSQGAYLSYDGHDAVMNSYMNSAAIALNTCPNANWDGSQTNFCAGVNGDDVIAHEWSHAYTAYTHGLIYKWQSGALNEAYSDIFGESIDLLNHRGTDSRNTPRTGETCSRYQDIVKLLIVHSPELYAGEYTHVEGALFGPPIPLEGLTGVVVAAQDGAADVNNGCEPLTNAMAVSGKIALIPRGTCNFTVKVKNAQDAGAIGVIIINNQPGNKVTQMGGTDSSITIPTMMVGYELGQTLNGANVTLQRKFDESLVDSYRWLLAEDSLEMGAIRDMRNPGCFGKPVKVSDTNYSCDSDDYYGVHTNSGVPSRAFAILVDGDAANGIAGVGLNKALPIYWRAASVYQHFITDFPDHADALEASCADLIGATLYDPMTGAALSETIGSGDCASLAQAIAATELRKRPTQCGFKTNLSQETPAQCTAEEGRVVALQTYNFDTAAGWQVEEESLSASYNTPNWTLRLTSHGGRNGLTFFAVASKAYGDCAEDVQSSMRYLESPILTAPTEPPYYFSFSHYFATEGGFDGGNVQIKVNDGSWQTFQSADFKFNPYNGVMAATAPYLAGKTVFTGVDEVSSGGSWGVSQLNLANYVTAGDQFQIRFSMAQDGCNGVDGWYVDDAQFYSCTTEPEQTYLYLPSVMK